MYDLHASHLPVPKSSPVDSGNHWNLHTCQKATTESSGVQTTKTGGSDPTFSAFSRPKSSWGRSRPFQQDATVALSRLQTDEPTNSKTHIAPGLFQRWQS